MGCCFSAPKTHEPSRLQAAGQGSSNVQQDAAPGAKLQQGDAPVAPASAAARVSAAGAAATNGHHAPAALTTLHQSGAGQPQRARTLEHQRSHAGAEEVYYSEGEGDDFMSCRDDFSVTDGSHLSDLGPGTPARSGHHHMLPPPDHLESSKSQRLSGAGSSSHQHSIHSHPLHQQARHPSHLQGGPSSARQPQANLPQQQPNQQQQQQQQQHQPDATGAPPPQGGAAAAGEQDPVQGGSETESEAPGEGGRKVGCFTLLEGLSIGRQHDAQPPAHSTDGGGGDKSGPLPSIKAGAHAGSRRAEKADAGCSLQPRDKSKSVLEVSGAYEDASASVFNIRSLDYMKTKVKIPSVPAIYQLAAADIFHFPKKHSHIAKHINLPATGPPVMAGDVALPPMLIFNLQLPLYMATLFGPQDGDGVSIVFYFRLPEDFDPVKFENQKALAIFKRFITNGREADGTATRDRLKLIPRVVNVDEWVRKGPLSPAEHKLLLTYNDKPILSRPQHLFFQGRGYFEVDLDLHQYTFLARRAITTYLQRLPQVIWENAFVVQGNGPDELPEHIIGVARIFKFDFTKAKPIPQRQSGTAPTVDGVPPSPS